MCVSVRENRAWCANQNHLPHKLCFANLLLTDLTFDLPRARFKQCMNGLCVCFCVRMCQFVWNYSAAVLLEVKLTPQFQTSERLPWWKAFAARTHPCRASHKMLPSLCRNRYEMLQTSWNGLLLRGISLCTSFTCCYVCCMNEFFLLSLWITSVCCIDLCFTWTLWRECLTDAFHVMGL